DGVARQAGVGEPCRLADAVGGAGRVGGRLPGSAAEDILVAVGGAARVFLGAASVVALIENVLTPLGDVAVHVIKAPGIGALLADRVRLLARVVSEPGEVAEPAGLAAERVIAWRSCAAGVFPLR